jgi:hypothetical protein
VWTYDAPDGTLDSRSLSTPRFVIVSASRSNVMREPFHLNSSRDTGVSVSPSPFPDAQFQLMIDELDIPRQRQLRRRVPAGVGAQLGVR